MTTPRWTEIAPSDYAHEREALAYMRAHLPQQEPFWGWSNFEFIDDQGRVNECDALVLSSHTLYLVEIKSRPGRITGDAGTWTWTDPQGRTTTDDNPYRLTNQKVKRLKSLLQRQKVLRNVRLPFMQAVVFLSAEDLDCRLTEDGWASVYLREGTAQQPGILDVLAGDAGPLPVKGHWRLGADLRRALESGMASAGIRPSTRQQRVGDYRLDGLLQESDAYQDWLGTHATLTKQRCRIRIYNVAPGASAQARAEVCRAAEREFLLTQRIHHAGVGRALTYTDLDRGPAVVFDHEPGTQRLDHYLHARHAQLDFETRLRLVRQLAEAVQHAHAQRVVHRALSPQAIHVVPTGKGREPQLRIVDWQLGHREGGTTVTQGAMDPGVLGDTLSLAYQAPEVMVGASTDGVKADVFSLGVVAYHVLTGRPAAASFAELEAKLRTGNGLLLAEALDGAGHALQDLIQRATRPVAVDRPDDMAAFLTGLDDAERERLAPAADEPTTHPADAQAGDVLPGGLRVLRRLGKGASSVAYEVEADGKRSVLKVALDAGQNERLRHEGEVLGALRHANIVPLERILELPGMGGPYVALQLGASGDGKTLAQRLREEGQLTLDLLARFGGELLDTVAHLEAHGISHRDIKPDNITIGETRTRARTLVLFDFSLSGTPVHDTRAGTPPYRDPFMRRRHKWDLHAERFAAAVTLYEMATGLTPTWGDGTTDPDYVGDALNLDESRLDPGVREGLMAFFRRALDAEASRRFDNAEAMQREWRRVFEALDRSAGDQGAPSEPGEWDLPRLKAAAPGTSLAALGLSVRLVNAAERLGVNTIGDLLALPRSRVVQAQGIGLRTLRELRELRDMLTEAHQAGSEQEQALPAGGTEAARWPVNKLAAQLLKVKLPPETLELIRATLGTDPRVTRPLPTAREAAEAVGASRQALAGALEDAVERWQRQAWMTALRDEVHGLLTGLAGLAGPAEVVAALLASRGSATAGPAREREGYAALAAALEVEAEQEPPRFQLYRGRQGGREVDGWLVPAGPGADERAAYAERLGEVADQLAAADPLAPPARVQEALRQVPPPADEAPWPTERLLQVAVAASRQAALSSRLELYPRGMDAGRAVRLAAGSLLGLQRLTPEQVHQRVRSRYPEAAELPTGEALGALLAASGLEYAWDGAAAEFRAPTFAPGTSTGTATGSIVGVVPARSDAEADALDLERRLRRVAAEGRFLVVNAAARRVGPVAAALHERHGFELLSVEAALIAAMKAVAAEMDVAWEVVLEADGAPRESADHRNLQLLVAQAVDRVRERVLASARPLVLQHLGLVARYQRFELLEALRDACRDPHQPTPGLVVLLGADDPQAMPVIDRAPVPVLEPADWTPMPEAWLYQAPTPKVQEATP
jgi:serine/threonine protein kinase